MRRLRYLSLIHFLILDLILILCLLVSFRELLDLQSQLKAAEERKEQTLSAEMAISRFDEKEADLQQGRFNRQVPLDVTFPLEAMGQIRNIAKESGIHEFKMNMQGQAPKPFLDLQDIKAFPLAVSLICGYESFINFLERLSSAEILLNVEALKIERNPKILPYINVEMIINTFTVITKKESPAFGEQGTSVPGPAEFMDRGSRMDDTEL